MRLHEYNPQLPDITSVTDAQVLRRVLQPACAEGLCTIIRLGGLSAESSGNHRGLLSQLARFGLGAELCSPPPVMAVLDWSVVRTCAADGLAFFGVIVRELSARGVHVVVCEPADGDLAGALQNSGIRNAFSAIHWIPSDSGPARRVEVIAPAALFGCTGSLQAPKVFAYQLHRALTAARVEPRRVERLVGAVVDLFQNILAHSDAEHACAVAVLHRRKRPPEIEVGIADGGRGIVTGVLMQERHHWLLPFTDAGVASAALTHGLSGRAEAEGGGALTGLIRELLDDCGATVIVRSEAALLTLSPRRGGCVPVHLSHGWGTQTLIRMRATA